MKKPGLLSRLFRPATKGLADPGPEVWGFFGIVAPAAGITISHAQALQVPAVASAVRLISEAAAILPCRVMERQADGTEKEAPDHPVNELLQVRANDWTTPYELIRDLVIDGLTDDRGGLAHEAKVEDRAVNEDLPPVGSPDTPIATIIPTEEATDGAPEVVVEAVEAPKRRRVRRKVSADVASEAVIEAPAQETPAEALVEAEPVAIPAQLDVEPVVAAKIEAAIEQALEPEIAPEPVAVAEPAPAPTAEVDVAAIIAEDPNQIVAPPEKPKRGWWRR